MGKKIISIELIPSTEGGAEANVFKKFQSEFNPNNALRFELSDDQFISVKTTLEEVDAEGNVTTIQGALMSSEGVVQVFSADGKLTSLQPGAIILKNASGIETMINNAGATANGTIDISAL